MVFEMNVLIEFPIIKKNSEEIIDTGKTFCKTSKRFTFCKDKKILIPSEIKELKINPKIIQIIRIENTQTKIAERVLFFIFFEIFLLRGVKIYASKIPKII